MFWIVGVPEENPCMHWKIIQRSQVQPEPRNLFLKDNTAPNVLPCFSNLYV